MEVPPLAHANPGLSNAGFQLTEPTELARAPVEATESRQIDRLLQQGGFNWLRFPGELEARFQNDSAARRLRFIVLQGAIVSVIYNWMLWPDWLMIPDVFDTALKVRLFVFTPCSLLGVFLITWLPWPALREWAVFSWGVCSAIITAALCAMSQDEMAAPYLVSLVAIVMYSNSVAQLRFFQAVLLDFIVLLLYAWALHTTPHVNPIIMVPATLTLVSSITFSLFGCYTLERDERRNWLMRERESLLLQELEGANEYLEEVSRSDMLTEVSNRRHFDEYLEHVWERAKRDGSDISLMMIDVDHFKAYNDRYGHPEGDACLREVAVTLKRRLRRPGDLIARFGGEEFIAILAGTPLGTATSAAERVRKGVENMNRLHATSTTHAVVTVSIGVACLRPNVPHASPAQLISAADEALYQAKARGRNRVFAFGTTD